VRLFIAVNIPDEMREKIWDCAAPLRDLGDAVRWVEPAGMHLTLKFLGEVSADREESVGLAMDASTAGVPQFGLTLGGFGAFPNTRRATVIWVGCESPSALQQLHQQVDKQMGGIGFPSETRAFHPHLTLGRLRRGAQSSAKSGLADMLDRLNFTGEVFVRSVELMQSELTPAGANYTVRKSIGLSK
jgi:2'-5' RNA ligase